MTGVAVREIVTLVMVAVTAGDGVIRAEVTGRSEAGVSALAQLAERASRRGTAPSRSCTEAAAVIIAAAISAACRPLKTKQAYVVHISCARE